MSGVADEIAPSNIARSTRFHLWNALLIAATAVFVTALISLTGNLQTFWPLYLIPIAIAALGYHVGGAILASAASTALVALLMPESTTWSQAFPELAMGLIAFALTGAVIGAQARRLTTHNQRLEQASIRDSLTGTYKAEYLHNRLREEIRRSDRYETPVGLAMIKVDGFDLFKERFGHYKGELLLEHLADLIRISVRDTDIVARYDTAEFVVVLPFSHPAECTAVGHRIHRMVSEADFVGDALEPATKIDVAVSAAAYPAEANSENTLIELATHRLSQTADPEQTKEQTIGGLSGATS